MVIPVADLSVIWTTKVHCDERNEVESALAIANTESYVRSFNNAFDIYLYLVMQCLSCAISLYRTSLWKYLLSFVVWIRFHVVNIINVRKEKA